MATRPVFVPDTVPDNPRLIHEHEVDFQWSTAGEIEGKTVNIARLNAAAGRGAALQGVHRAQLPLAGNICLSCEMLLPLVALAGKQLLAEVSANPDLFIETLKSDPFYQSDGGT